jgi:hypothetical protein
VVEIDKCNFDQKEVEFLGFLLSGDGLKMVPSRSKAITKWSIPTTQQENQKILGLGNFYQRFIKGYAGIVAPITNTRKGNGQNFEFGEAQKQHTIRYVHYLPLKTHQFYDITMKIDLLSSKQMCQISPLKQSYHTSLRIAKYIRSRSYPRNFHQQI